MFNQLSTLIWSWRGADSQTLPVSLQGCLAIYTCCKTASVFADEQINTEDVHKPPNNNIVCRAVYSGERLFPLCGVFNPSRLVCSRAAVKRASKTFEELHRRCFFILSLNSATEGRKTDSNTRRRISEYDFCFPLRRTGVRGSAHVYGCSHRYSACCGFVCDRMCKHAYMHVSLFILSRLSHALACFFLFNRHFQTDPPPSHTQTHTLTQIVISDLCILITLSNCLAGLQEHFPPFFLGLVFQGFLLVNSSEWAMILLRFNLIWLAEFI